MALLIDGRRAARATSRIRRWPEMTALAVILVGALSLRIIGLRAGLPGPGLLSPDENTVVPIALRMVTEGDLNPHWFLYPSLYLILVGASVGALRGVIPVPEGLPFASPEAFAYDPSPYLLTGRVVSVVAGLALVVAVWLLARELAGTGAGLFAGLTIAVAPITVTYSHLAVTDMTMTALLTFALWQVSVAINSSSPRREVGPRPWRREIRRTQDRALTWAAILVGLATSTKYNAGFAIFLVVGVAAWMSSHDGGTAARGVRAAGRLTAIWLAAFFVGTPAALFDPRTFAADFVRQNRIVSDGWLGFEDAGPGWLYNLHPVLGDGLGTAVLAIGIVGVVLAAWRRRPIDVALVGFTGAYFAYVSSWNAHFDRYLLPIVPVLVALGAAATLAAFGWLRTRTRLPGTAFAVVVLAAIVAPSAWSSADLVSGFGQRDLRLDAVPAIARIVPVGVPLVVDPLGPPFIDRATGRRLMAAGISARGFVLIRLRTPQPGLPTDPNRDVRRLRARGLRWVVTSDDIARRVANAPTVYPNEERFYRQLRRRARPVLRVPASLGPGVVLWDLGPPKPAEAMSATASANVVGVMKRIGRS